VASRDDPRGVDDTLTAQAPINQPYDSHGASVARSVSVIAGSTRSRSKLRR
jgi:hypothetical protein